MPKIKVLIADDHPVFREGLHNIIKHVDRFECVAVARNGAEAVKLAKELHPDVAMVDVDMPQMTGMEVAKLIKESCPRTAVLMLSAFNYDDYIIKSIEAGAAGYVLKTLPPTELIDAVTKIYQGKTVFDPEATYRLLHELTALKRDDVSGGQLHPREVEVLRLASRGKTNKQIGLELGISESTVGSHMINIFRKLGVDSRTEAACRALELGWLTFEDRPEE